MRWGGTWSFYFGYLNVLNVWSVILVTPWQEYALRVFYYSYFGELNINITILPSVRIGCGAYIGSRGRPDNQTDNIQVGGSLITILDIDSGYLTHTHFCRCHDIDCQL